MLKITVDNINSRKSTAYLGEFDEIEVLRNRDLGPKHTLENY